MPTEIRLWAIEHDKPKQINQEKLNFEARIENWIKDDVALISPDLLIIGQQVPTAYGGSIDLLAMDTVGNLVILELKRDKTPRDIVAQVLDYASWVQDLGHDEIQDIAGVFLKDISLDQAFQKKFQTDLPEVLNERHRMYIVASQLDSATERIVKYLSETHNVDVNVATFSYFNTDKGEFLGRSLLLDEDIVQKRAETKSKRKPPKTLDEIRSIAEGNGVVELFDEAISNLRPLLDGMNRTRANIALVGNMQDGKSRNTLISIYPEASTKDNGLALLFFIERVCEYFNVDENELREFLGPPCKDIQTWNPDSSFFFDKERLSKLIQILRKDR